MMNAVRIHTTGSTNTMVYENAPRPEPAADEILIRVHAAGVNPVDWKMRIGAVPLGQPHFPAILGRDVSGVVVRRGGVVDTCNEGDPVFALLQRHGGGYAEYALAAVGEFAPKPRNLQHTEAAAVPLAALTAWQGLFEHGGLADGQTVLIHGAGGGVGHFAVQFARLAGARVVATASAADLNFVSALGADIVLDLSAMPFQRVVNEVDLVFDLVAGVTQKNSWAVLRDGGTLVSALGPPRREPAAPPRSSGKGFLVRPDAAQLRHIGVLLEQGDVTVRVSRELALAQARTAHELLETEHNQGKTVLRVVRDHAA